MSDIWERSIHEWYEKSHTAHLEYLDLATTAKPTSSQIAHNLSVIFYRICLSSRVSIKHLKKIQEALQSQETQLQQLQDEVKRLRKLQAVPLNADQVRDLVKEISKQPKQIEKQAINLVDYLAAKVDRIESILHRLEQWSSS